MDAAINSPSDPASPPERRVDPETISDSIESPSGGALWRAYLTSVLSKPIIREEEVRDEVQTAA
jgi:hypothetical protein